MYIRWILIFSLFAIAGLERVFAEEVESSPAREDVQRLSNAYYQIKRYYVEPINNKKLFEDAIRGMASGLDPHSSYLDEQDLKDLQDVTTGEFGGLGLEVSMENGYIKVISPIDDTPAQKAGIKPGDMIVRLDDTPIKGMSLRDAIKKMRGKKGSEIELTLFRKGDDQPLKVKLIREIIRIHSVKSYMLEKGYGYIRLSTFMSQTAVDMKKAVQDLKNQAGGRLKGLVLDLRNNPGGLLDAAVEVSDAFLPSKPGNKGLIVYTKGRLPETQFEARATGGDMLDDAPMVILINEGSASGSEIVAGALQDQKRAILLGTNSFGKGSVQTVLPLDAKSGIKLTTALYYTPLGRSIQAQGIKPDIIVENKQMSEVKDKKDNNEFSIKEADLERHLANGNQKDTQPEQKAVVKEENKPASLATDYQLNEALNILKAMVLIDQKKD